MARDQWLNHRPAVRTGKINKKIVLSAFSAACGPTRACIDTWYLSSAFAEPDGFTTDVALTHRTSNFTFECWLKQMGSPDVGYDNGIYERVAATTGMMFNVYINDSFKIVVQLRIGGVVVTHTSTVVIPHAEWCHIAVSYDSSNVRIYLNGVKKQTIVQAGALNAAVGTLSAHIGTKLGVSINALVKTYIDEIRFWHTTLRSDEDIFVCYDKHVNKISGDSVQDNLEYFSIDEAEGAAIITSDFGAITAGAIDAAKVTREEYAPIKFGGSFIVKEYIVDVDAACSIVFPVTRPDGANHALFVSWQDEDNITHRLRLYSADPEVGEETVFNAEDYSGERLPAVGFTLEFWNIDGEETVDLEDDLDIRLSLTSNPTYSNDHTAIEADEPVENTTLAIPTGVALTNPLTPSVAPSF
jgi:hypothetical protein